MKKSFALTIMFILVCSSVCFAKVIKQYYPNGTLRSVLTYNNKNQLNGPYKYYWPNGKLKEKGRNKNGYPVGPIKRYSADGVLLK